MKVEQKWRQLGWRDPHWDYVRFFTSFRKGTKKQKEWIDKLRKSVFEVESDQVMKVPPARIRCFLEYIDAREGFYLNAVARLRTKEQALAFCKRLKAEVTMTRTKLQGWTDAPKAMVAAVTNISKLICQKKGFAIEPNPQRRCVWFHENKLHVSVRNLDGAIPTLASPNIVWEIKEYWGGGEGKKGGSKMSDAVYECNLVGRELREFEDIVGHPHITHIVFLDGKQQWVDRDSDLKRMIDLFHQGLIDYLIIGSEVETEWEAILTTLLKSPTDSSI